MATTNATVTLTLQYTPPNAAVNSGISSFSLQVSYTGQQVGQIDVQNTDTLGTIFAIPFGSITAAKVLIIKNMMSTEIGFRINGSGTNDFNIPSGGQVAYAAPTAPLAVPWTSASIITTAMPTVTENINVWVFGD